MENNKTKNLTVLGLLIALVSISTMVIQVPVPATEGYIHLGDSVIFLVGILFGSRRGMIAGGLGSAIADILTGYTHWAIPTLIIKGIMGYLVGKISNIDDKNILNTRNIISLIVGVIWMVFGYFLSGAALKGSFLVSATSIPSNLVQGIGGALIFIPLGIALKKTDIAKKYV